MQEKLINSAIVVLAVCAIITTGLVIQKTLRGSETSPLQKVVEVRDWKSLADAGVRAGSDTAKVVIVEFSDFACPYCALMVSPLTEISRKYPETVAVIYRHFPREGNPGAHRAATAAECGRQQDRFLQVRSILFQNQKTVVSDDSGDLLDSLIGNIDGLDMNSFSRCMSDSSTSRVVDVDVEAGKIVGISATPTIVVNNKMISGAKTFAQLDSLVLDAIR